MWGDENGKNDTYLQEPCFIEMMRMIPVSKKLGMGMMRMIPVSRRLSKEGEELVKRKLDCFPPTEPRLSGSVEPETTMSLSAPPATSLIISCFQSLHLEFGQKANLAHFPSEFMIDN